MQARLDGSENTSNYPQEGQWTNFPKLQGLTNNRIGSLIIVHKQVPSQQPMTTPKSQLGLTSACLGKRLHW
jgi:hypothetical protein